MTKSLKRHQNIKVHTWVNDNPITDANWEVWGTFESDDDLYILVKDPINGNQLKINIKNYENLKESTE